MTDRWQAIPGAVDEKSFKKPKTSGAAIRATRPDLETRDGLGTAGELRLNEIVPPTPALPTAPTGGRRRGSSTAAAAAAKSASQRQALREQRDTQRLEAKREKAVRYRDLTCPRRKFFTVRPAARAGAGAQPTPGQRHLGGGKGMEWLCPVILTLG